MKVGICAIMKDVYEPYLIEWLNHHRSIGVDLFFIYDNDSSIPILSFDPDVIVYKISGPVMQIPVYNKLLSDMKSGILPHCDRVAFIDEDEFIHCENGDIKSTLSDYSDFPALGITWRVFGSSGLKSRTPEPQRSKFIQFTHGHPYERHIKSIVDPSRTICSSGNPHAFCYTRGNCVNVNKEIIDGPLTTPIYHKIWIDHYYTRSLEEWKDKVLTVRVDSGRLGRDYNLINEIDASCSGHYPESTLAHKYCKGHGLEIGGAAHNPFGLDALNVDLTDSMETIFKQEETYRCGKALPVDIVANGDTIPLPNNTQDFIVSSHVFEHFTNPIKALMEWDRLLKPNGIIFMIVPHKERTFDQDNPRTPLQHLIQDYNQENPASHENQLGHNHCWITEDIVELVQWMMKNLPVHWEVLDVQDIDDKAGNGFTIVIRKAIPKNIHLIMPFSRYHLWDKLIENYRPMNVILHPLTLSHEPPIETSEDWIQPIKSTATEFNQSALLNEFIRSNHIIDDDYYVSVSDDDMYEPDVFNAIRNMDDPVVVISMKRGYKVPPNLPPEKRYPPTTLIASSENMRMGCVGGEQMFIKGSALKTVYFDEVNTSLADGFVAESLKSIYPIRYEPDLFILFNYYDPERWKQMDGGISFGVIVNSLLRLDMVLKRSQLNPSIPCHTILNPESAAKGLNKLLDTIEHTGADVAILVHQDMYFRNGWTEQVQSQLKLLPSSWIVAGVVGKDHTGLIAGKFHDMRIPDHFDTSDIHTFPCEVCCFDEAVIIVNLKSGFRFDETMEGFDLYGTLCVLQAWEMGGTAWVIDAFCEHYCMRPFTWAPNQLFVKNYKWLFDKFSAKWKLDSTALGLSPEAEERVRQMKAFMTSAALEG